MNVILDTGPWVALIDRSETMHEKTVAWLREFEGNLYSTEAVLTEVLFLLDFSVRAQGSAIDFVTRSVVDLVPSSPESLAAVKRLMRKHSDLPMDYAAATIVALAMETGIDQVATFDRRDFSVYRLTRNKVFTLLPP